MQLLVTKHDETHNMAVAASALWLLEGDAAAATAHLRLRVGTVMATNPWLAARYVKGGPEGKMCWMYPRTLNDLTPMLMKRHFSEGEMDMSSINHSYIAHQEQLRPYLCVNANSLAREKDGSAFRVSVIKDSGHAGWFALVISINHVLADGATMYAVARMLSGEDDSSVLSLQVDRVCGLAQAQDKVVGKCEKDMFSFGNKGFLVGLIAAVLGDLIRGKHRDVLMTQIFESWLAQQKKDAAVAAKVPFVSTNDVLTSLLFRELIPARVGLMEVNLRDRDQQAFQVTSKHAGNYTVMVPYFYGDADTPDLVRSSLKSNSEGFTARRATNSKVPGFQGMLSGPGRYVAVTNWASIDTPMTVPNCKTILHLPMMDMTVPSLFDGAIIWRPAPNCTALVAFSRKKGLLPANHAAFGGQVHAYSILQKNALKLKKE